MDYGGKRSEIHKFTTKLNLIIYDIDSSFNCKNIYFEESYRK